MMAATKPTTLHSERRLSPSTSPIHHSSMSPRPDRSNPRGPFSGGTNIALPALTKKTSSPSYLKPKVASPSEPPSQTSSSTFSGSSKSFSIRKPIDKPPSCSTQTQRAPPSTPVTQKSLKPASHTSRLSNSSKSDVDKAASRITRSSRSTPVMKSKSSSSTIKKKEYLASVEAASSPGKHPLDDRVVMDEIVAEASAELTNFVDVSEVRSHGVEEENHMEEHNGGELEQWRKRFEPQVVNEDFKQQVEVDEAPKPTGVVMATLEVEQEDEVRAEPAKAETVVRQVMLEARKPSLVMEVASMVAATCVKKKVVPRSNDVIEETKSKLMGTRKNRVLELVGAFETVISLQDPETQQNQKALQAHHDQQIHKAWDQHKQENYWCFGLQDHYDQHGDKIQKGQPLRGYRAHQVEQSEEDEQHQNMDEGKKGDEVLKDEATEAEQE